MKALAKKLGIASHEIPSLMNILSAIRLSSADILRLEKAVMQHGGEGRLAESLGDALKVGDKSRLATLLRSILRETGTTDVTQGVGTLRKSLPRAQSALRTMAQTRFGRGTLERVADVSGSRGAPNPAVLVRKYQGLLNQIKSN